MLVNRYIDLKYEYGFYQHCNEYCSCDLSDGGKGLCNYGRYNDELISPQEFLEEYEDDFYDLKFGTFVRTAYHAEKKQNQKEKLLKQIE